MPHFEAGKAGFLLDLVQLVFGSTVALIILGVIVAACAIFFVASKVMSPNN